MSFGRPGEQLRLFAPASELMSGLMTGGLGSEESELYTDDGTRPAPGTPQEASANLRMMRQKGAESKRPYESGEHGAGVYDSIKKHGFQGHVTLNMSHDRPNLWEGHHRLASANLTNGDQFVGLNYTDPLGAHGPKERSKPVQYQEAYPQNVGDDKWSAGATLDDPTTFLD